MPELPEVEHARLLLSKWLVGTRICRVDVADERILDHGKTAARMKRALSGRRVTSVDRRGKWLRIVLDRGSVFSHLGMTGKWILVESRARPGQTETERFEKVRLDVTKGRTKRSVRYLDSRLFGRFVVAEEAIAAWTELGPDPLHDGVDARELARRLAKRSVSIKAALLDQSVLAGVGNIQATDALFLARIDPRTPAKRIDAHHARALARAIEKSIARTLAGQTSGTSTAGKAMRYFGERGSKEDPNPFVVYGRAGAPCPRCGTKLSKIVLAGRGTVFCRVCQKRP